jgi:membrane dipeptidase
MPANLTPIFDGHNDFLLHLWLEGGDPAQQFLNGRPRGQFDLPRAKAGGFAGGLFAMFPPSPRMAPLGTSMNAEGYSVPMPPTLPLDEGRRATLGMAAAFLRLARNSGGAFRACTTVAEIRAAMADGAIAGMLHLEGADGIDTDLEMLEVLYAAGLRSIGPVWSRSNAFADGVPLAFPASPDIGNGLTDAGKNLVRVCNQMSIMIDMSHMTEKGFWDVAATSTAPLVATHSNVHALSASSRNLTDKQLDAIRERDGMVGLNFATCFLREDGRMRGDVPIETMIRHLDYLVERLGEDHVGLGSDFDGATVPDPIKNVAGLPLLIDAMRSKGYGEPLITKIASENWLSLLERTGL